MKRRLDDLSVAEMEALTPVQIAALYTAEEIQEELQYAGTEMAFVPEGFYPCLQQAAHILANMASDAAKGEAGILARSVLNGVRTIENLISMRNQARERGEEKMGTLFEDALALLQPSV